MLLNNSVPILEKIDGIVMKTGDEEILFDTDTGEIEVLESIKHAPKLYIRTEIVNSDDWQP